MAKFRPKIRIWNPGGTAPKMGDDLSGTEVYHRAKFHADRCHSRRDIYNRTEKKHSNQLYPSILTYGGRVKICNSCTAGIPAPEFEHFGRYLQYIGLFWRQTRRRDALQNSTRPPRRVTTRRSMLTTAYRSWIFSNFANGCEFHIRTQITTR